MRRVGVSARTGEGAPELMAAVAEAAKEYATTYRPGERDGGGRFAARVADREACKELSEAFSRTSRSAARVYPPNIPPLARFSEIEKRMAAREAEEDARRRLGVVKLQVWEQGCPGCGLPLGAAFLSRILSLSVDSSTGSPSSSRPPCVAGRPRRRPGRLFSCSRGCANDRGRCGAGARPGARPGARGGLAGRRLVGW